MSSFLIKKKEGMSSFNCMGDTEMAVTMSRNRAHCRLYHTKKVCVL